MPNLILIPTELERQSIASALRLDATHWQLETVGFGVIAAAVHSSRLIAAHQPSRVIVAGIAGLFSATANAMTTANAELAVGSACWFGRVAIDGIGVGQGEQFVDARQLGWKSAPDENGDGTLSLDTPDATTDHLLLTVCSASASAQEAEQRRQRHPNAVGEDMETYAVAMACRAADVPCAVIRGFSNATGCRDHASWQIRAALKSVSERLQPLIDQSHS